MPVDSKNRPFTMEKTGVEDLEKLKEVKRSLLPPDAVDNLRQRARIRREFNTRPISQPVANPQAQFETESETLYQIDSYSPDSDRWRVHSVSNPSDQFLAVAIKAGGIAIGDTVRGYPPVAIEQQPQGRRFKLIEESKPKLVKDVTITISIGYTGRK